MSPAGWWTFWPIRRGTGSTLSGRTRTRYWCSMARPTRRSARCGPITIPPRWRFWPTRAAIPDGTVLLYDSSAGTFTVSRKDFTALSGAYAASDAGQFAIDNKLLNQSLARVAELDKGQGGTSGFAFVGDSVLRTSGPVTNSTSTAGPVLGAPGVIERVSLANPAIVLSTRTVEAPRFPTSTAAGGTVASGGATSAASQFIRSLVTLANGNIISLTQSGFVTLSSNFDATTSKPVVNSVVNTSDPSQALTGGG